jgi:hypothetical protein
LELEAMKRPFKCARQFTRYGLGGRYSGTEFGRWRSFKTLRAAVHATRLDLAEIEADGYKLPLCVTVHFEHYKRNGVFFDSEIVAIWKRGRIVWRDPVFVRKGKH